MSNEARRRLITIVKALARKDVVSASDIVLETGLPRYYVLAVIQCLEALGFIELVYSRGSYKLYAPRPALERLLQALESGSDIAIQIIGVPQVREQSSNTVAAAPEQ